MPDKKKGKQVEAEAESLSGVFIFPNSDKYEGEYQVVDGAIRRSGTGIHVTSEGLRYEGQWAEDKMNGQGQLQHPSGCTYEGDFVNNKFQGQGKYSWPNGSFYIGDFKENKMEGDGEFTDTEGQIWTGKFLYRAAPGLRFKLGL